MSGAESADPLDPVAAALGRAPPTDPVEPARLFDELQAALFGKTTTTMSLARYEVHERIGGGGMGVVHRGFDPELARDVAIKLIPSDENDPRRARASLLREAQALARVAHPNVVAVHDVGAYELVDELHAADDEPKRGGVFIVMELITGPTLQEWSLRRSRGHREVVSRFLQAAKGLAAAHRAGVVHRDFKPGNAVVGTDGRVRVLDFGLARGSSELRADTAESTPTAAIRDLARTLQGSSAGTPAYMSPEQHKGEFLDAASDQYSFCVALFEAVYHKLPFEGRTWVEIGRAKEANALVALPADARVPNALHRAIVRGLAVDPGDRHASMDELVAVLDRVAKPKRRHWLFAGTFASACGAAAVVLTAPHAHDGPREAVHDARMELSVAEPPLPDSDRPTPMTAALVHRDGREELGFVRDATTDPTGRVVALLGLDGALRVDHGDRVELVAHDVVPGMAACSQRRLVYVQEFGRYAEPRPELRAFVYDNGVSRGLDVDPRTLDRVLALSPDCERVVVVVRHGGWPVVSVARLDGTTPLLGLTNLALADMDGLDTPADFVPPPIDGASVTWIDDETIHWVVDDVEVSLDLRTGAPLPSSQVKRSRWSRPVALDRYRVPVAAGFEITRYFDLGGARDYACGDRTFPGHRGTDFAPVSADADMAVLAAAEGLVVAAHDGEHDGCETGNCYTGAGLGNHVILRHPDGKHTVYAHLLRFSVRVQVGEIVECGAPVGTVGASGPATGVHLHFEVRNAAGHHTIDDPFAGPCGGTMTYWVDAGPLYGTPGDACEQLGE
jgi:murein DD-endopeptidase MepM/ murein hydrolase activator NlpD